MVCAAVFYSVIYGNIAQFIQSSYSSTLRYRKRMDEVAEFARFHRPATRHSHLPTLHTSFHATHPLYLPYHFSPQPTTLRSPLHDPRRAAIGHPRHVPPTLQCPLPSSVLPQCSHLCHHGTTLLVHQSCGPVHYLNTTVVPLPFRLPSSLRVKMRQYLEFAFSVTKGIPVETIVAQLPAHLQLEVHLELNKKLVEQVRSLLSPRRITLQGLSSPYIRSHRAASHQLKACHMRTLSRRSHATMLHRRFDHPDIALRRSALLCDQAHIQPIPPTHAKPFCAGSHLPRV